MSVCLLAIGLLGLVLAADPDSPPRLLSRSAGRMECSSMPPVFSMWRTARPIGFEWFISEGGQGATNEMASRARARSGIVRLGFVRRSRQVDQDLNRERTR